MNLCLIGDCGIWVKCWHFFFPTTHDHGVSQCFVFQVLVTMTEIQSTRFLVFCNQVLVKETVICHKGQHRQAISLVRREKHRCSLKVRRAGCSQVFDTFLVRSVVVFNSCSSTTTRFYSSTVLQLKNFFVPLNLHNSRVLQLRLLILRIIFLPLYSPNFMFKHSKMPRFITLLSKSPSS